MPVALVLVCLMAPSGVSGDEVPLPALFRVEMLDLASADSPLRRLLKGRYNAAVAELKDRAKGIQAGQRSFVDILELTHRLLHAGVEAHDTPKAKVDLLEKGVAMLRQMEKQMEAAQAAGTIPATHVYQVRYARLDAEILLLRTKGDADPGKDR